MSKRLKADCPLIDTDDKSGPAANDPIADVRQIVKIPNVNSIRLHFRVVDQRHGELTAFVRCDEFSGRGAAWFFTNQIREFLTAISAFPIPIHNGPKLEGGFHDESGETLQQCHLSVRLSPHDRLGLVRVTASVATQADRNAEKDLQQSLTGRFLVNYGDIDRFGDELAAMLERGSGEATLQGSQ